MKNEIRRLPENSNKLQTTKYTFIIPNLPFATYFCQTATIPGVSTSAVNIPTPFSDTYRHGDKLSFEPLVITALLDEDLRIYEETFNWFRSLTYPVRQEEYAQHPLTIHDENKNLYYDGILTVNTNSNVPNVRFKFFNLHPTSLGTIKMDTTSSSEEIMAIDITFQYDRFEIERLR